MRYHWSRRSQLAAVTEFWKKFEIWKYSETCIRRNRMGPKIFSTLDKFPHYTKLQKKYVKPIKIILPTWCIPVYTKSAALALISR
jgi:hypothetical protein